MTTVDIWKELRPKVEAMITERLMTFHDGLIEDGQIALPPKPNHPTEVLINHPLHAGL
jgi:hypothetical protein